jgi:DNA-binding CsgD family transcriptional regulator
MTPLSPTLAPSRDLPLTAREHEVLQWLAGGKTDRDIAEILSISPRTVHKHLQRIYEKLGVETRTAAVMRAFFAPSVPG